MAPLRMLALAALAAASTACSSAPPVVARAPAYEPDQQTKSRVHASPLEPLVVEWPAAARAELETQARRGVVAVRYDGETVEVLSGCRSEGKYTYAGTNVHRDRLVISDADELAAKLPLGVASLSGKLEQSGRLEVSLTVVGAYALDRDSLEVDGSGACSRATHFVSMLSAGAFELSSGGAAGASASADAGGAGLGASHQSRREVITRAGDVEACAGARPDDTEPPAGCGALVRVVLTPVHRAPPEPAREASPPPVATTEVEPPAAPPPRASSEPAPARREPPAPAPPPVAASSGFWTYLGAGTLLAVLGGVVIAGVIVKANKEEPSRGPAPTGGLGSVTLGAGAVRW